MGLLRTVIVWVALGYAGNLVLKTILQSGVGKQAYNHAPGKCALVEGVETGSEDIELLPNDIAFISSGLNYMNVSDLAGVQGAIFLFDFASNSITPRAKQAKIVPSKSFNIKTFNPHGMSSFTKNGVTTLYVINHRPEGGAVECFTFDKEKSTLTHTKTITDPLILQGANDLVTVDQDMFYLSNDHYFDNDILRLLESILQLKFGSVVFYNGQKATIVDDHLLTPNGVALNKDKSILYVSMPGAQHVRLYKIHSSNKTIDRIKDIALGTHPDNVFVDAAGDLWLGCHPILYETFGHMLHPKTHTAPSQVLRLSGVSPSSDKWTLTEPYSNDGKVLAASTITVFHKDQLLIGTIQQKLLHCRIDDSHTL